MKFFITGGTGHVGRDLVPRLISSGHSVTVASRQPGDAASLGLPHGVEVVQWDGRRVGDWTRALDGADAVLNMAGRSVNCRYSNANLREMMDSRVDSTRVMGAAIAGAKRPPRAWLQMSTATIYAHRFDAANDEFTGIIGGNEAGVPGYWKRSIDIATAWERELEAAPTPETRKVALRAAMVMNTVPGSVFDILSRLVRMRMGGAIAGGRQFVSWIHGEDFARAVEFLAAAERMSGAVNVAAPNPLPQREFMAALRQAMGVGVGLPVAGWMCKLGAAVIGSDTELLLKSRRVVPGRLLEAGFAFRWPEWRGAAVELAGRRRGRAL